MTDILFISSLLLKYIRHECSDLSVYKCLCLVGCHVTYCGWELQTSFFVL